MTVYDGQTKPKNTGRMKGLEFDQAVVNIGEDPANDIRLSGEGVKPFHAALVVKEGEYRLMSLAPDADIRLDGERMTEPTILLPDQKVELGSYSLFVKPNGTPNSVHVLVSQPHFVEVNAGIEEVKPTVWKAKAGDQFIRAKVLGQQLNVVCKQTAYIELQVVNAGPVVATLALSVLVDAKESKWTKITPEEINLSANASGIFTVEITPPEEPDSSAGMHPVSLIVSSPEYEANQACEVAVELEIQPYYRFHLGDLEPKDQRIPWRKHTGKVRVPITNQGNSPAKIEVEAKDDENGCEFNLHTPDDVVDRQAVLEIPAGAIYPVDIDITPKEQPWIALRNKEYHYTTSVQVAGQPAGKEMRSGKVVSSPLIGWWTIVLILLALAVGIFLLVQPRIHYFGTREDQKIINLGESVDLEWDVSPFATRLSISSLENINRSQKRVTVTPDKSTVYEMVAGNWLSSLFNLDDRETVYVLVVPPSPKINVFTVDAEKVLKGVPTKMRWSVEQADRAILTIDNVVYELTPDQFSGGREEVLENDALVTLEAINASGSQLKSYYINVEEPQIKIERFEVYRRKASTSTTTTTTTTTTNTQTGSDFTELYVSLKPTPDGKGYMVDYNQKDGEFQAELDKGEQILVKWKVSQAQSVQIAPFTEVLPAEGEQPFFPQQSMNLVLTAAIGDVSELQMLPLRVFDGQPPVAPTIDFFKASPSAIVGPGDVQFAWSISGAYTKIQLNMGDTIIASDGLKPQDFRTVKVSKTSTFILTAWNGDLSKAETLEVVVNPALKRTTLTIEDVSPHTTYFQVGETVTVTVKIVGLDQETGTPAPTGKVTVSDGTAVCTYELPLNSCKLTFASSGKKDIKASYAGDKVYLPSDSAVYTKELIFVDANKVDLSLGFFTPPSTDISGNSVPARPLQGITAAAALGEGVTIQANTLYTRQMGQGIMVDVTVIPQNKPISDDKGEVTVRYCEVINGVRDDSKCGIAGPAKVVPPTDPSVTIGKAQVVIGQFTKMGRYALVISYRHTQDAFEPVLIGTTSGEEYLLDVKEGKMVLVLQTPLKTPVCSYKECTYPETTSANLVFNAMLLSDDQGDTDPTNDVVASMYPNYVQPGNLTFTATPDTSVSGQPGWAGCSWQVGAVRQVYCQGINMNQEITLDYKFTTPSASDPKSDGNYIIDSVQGLLKIRYQSIFTGATDKQTYLGKNIQLLLGAIQLKANNLSFPAEYTLERSDGGDLSKDLAIIDGTNCSLDAGKLKITQSTTPSSDKCEVYFKNLGTIDVKLVFPGSADRSSAEAAFKFIVGKQTGLAVSWSTSSTQPEIAVEFTRTMTLSCPSSNTTYCGTNFAYAVLSGAKMTVDRAQMAQCTITGTELAIENNVLTLTLPTLGEGATAPTSDFKITCLGSGSRTLTMDFQNPYSQKFSLDPSATQSLIFTLQPKAVTTAVTLSTSQTGGTNLVTGNAITQLKTETQYWLSVKITGVPTSVPLDPVNNWVKVEVTPQNSASTAATDFMSALVQMNTGSDCAFVPVSGSAGYIKLGLAAGTNAGEWVSTPCAFMLDSSKNLASVGGAYLTFTLQPVGAAAVVTSTVNLTLPTITTDPQLYNFWVKKANAVMPSSNPNWSVVSFTENNVKKVAELSVGEVYQLGYAVAHSDLVWYMFFYQPVIRIPTTLANLVDKTSTNSTCFSGVHQTVGSEEWFYPGWKVVGNTAETSCQIQIKTAGSIGADKYIYLTRRDFFFFIPWDIGRILLPTNTTKLSPTISAVIKPQDANNTRTTWYLAEKPYVEVTLSDGSSQYNIMSADQLQYLSVTGATFASPCTTDTTAGTYKCYFTKAESGTVTVSYKGSPVFADITDITKQYTINQYATSIPLTNIKLVNALSQETPFPESYMLSSDVTTKVNFLRANTDYKIRVKVSTETGVTAIPTGKVSLTFTVKYTDTDTPATLTTLTADLDATGVATFNAARISVSPSSAIWKGQVAFVFNYAGDSQFAASEYRSEFPNPSPVTLLRYPLSVSVPNGNSSILSFAPMVDGTAIKSVTTNQNRYCLDVYLEVSPAPQPTCDGQNCWTRQDTGEKVAILCDTTSAPLADSGHTYDTTTPDPANNIESAADDRITLSTAINWSVAKYQIIVISNRFIAILTPNSWP